MSYGVLLKNSNTNQSFLNDSLTFYPTSRGGISTSDAYYFNLIKFMASSMSLNFAQFGNLIGLSNASRYSNINFNLNAQNFYGVGLNLSKPTLVEICNISSYEVGAAQTVYSSFIAVGDKAIRNFTDPGNIYAVTSLLPLGLQTSYFGLSLNYSRPSVNVGGINYDVQNFLYVKFVDLNVTKYFIAIPLIIGAAIPNNFTWYEIPTETFYFPIDFYTTFNVSTVSFNGASLPLSIFNGIIPTTGQTIVVNNYIYNDTLSGVYIISRISDKIYLTQGSIFYNYPGQIFNIKTDLDLSNSYSYTSSSYYVPFGYGVAAEPFSKNLQLKKFINVCGGLSTSYVPMYQDQYSKSSLILYLNTQYQFTKQSDTFVLGIAASNWCQDSTLFGVDLNYEIKEGY